MSNYKGARLSLISSGSIDLLDAVKVLKNCGQEFHVMCAFISCSDRTDPVVDGLRRSESLAAGSREAAAANKRRLNQSTRNSRWSV